MIDFQSFINGLTPGQSESLEEFAIGVQKAIDATRRFSELSNAYLADKLIVMVWGEYPLNDERSALIDVVCDRLNGYPVGKSYLDDEESE